MRNFNRKYILSGILIVALSISIMINIVTIFNYTQSYTPRDPTILIRASGYNPYTLEIVDSYDYESSNVLEQVVETLFSYDLRDPNLPLINLLAESYHWKNKTILQINLREGISFHDGTPFNSIAAKWNLDRLQFLTNCTGTNLDTVALTQSLWMRSDGKTPIINSTATVGDYNITITLNGPYSSFLDTLTLINAGMISPTFHEAIEHSFIPLSGGICGTGPFVFDHYLSNVEVRFSRWEGYWRHVAYFSQLVFKIYDKYSMAHADMLSGEIDFNSLASYTNMLEYETREEITVKHYTDDTGIPDLIYGYIQINNENYNKTWRKVFSHAINYSYIINDFKEGRVIRANSPISPGFGTRYNESAKAADFNITKAREIIVSMGLGSIEWTDEQWIAKSESDPFFEVIYDYGRWSYPDPDLFFSIQDTFKLIGIDISNSKPEWTWIVDYEPTYTGFSGPIGYSADHLGPCSILSPLFTPSAWRNLGEINDTRLNDLMALALETTDDAIRNTIYKDIQGYIAEEGYFHIPLYHYKLIFSHSADLYNVPYNALGKFQAYDIWRA